MDPIIYLAIAPVSAALVLGALMLWWKCHEHAPPPPELNVTVLMLD